MNTDVKLPLKKVTVRETDYFRPGGGGSSPKIFGPVTAAVRQRLTGQLQRTASYFESAFEAYPKVAAVARLALKEDALAKSHRPSHLLHTADCPIVGVGNLGELLVSVRRSTLPRLVGSITSDQTKQGVANISTIKDIKPFEIGEDQVRALKIAVKGEALAAVKLRLFRHQNDAVDGVLTEAFKKKLKQLRIDGEPINYGHGMSVYRLRGVRAENVEELRRFVGTQSLGAFPEYHIVRPAALPISKLTAAQFPPPDPNLDYPVVGIIDSGVDPSNPLLSAWVLAREEYVPENDRDYEHGSFVAGLIVHSRMLNHDDVRFPQASCRIVDVVAMPRSGTISEDDLLAILWEVVPKYPEVRVWNLSLAGNQPCSDHAFSDLAVALDEIQTQYGVTFVLAAGNYSVPPFRDWPVTAGVGDNDRVCGPADSVRALTVGSIAHRDSPQARVVATSPSPFSRRGPGPVYLPKPEVTHFGGNCDSRGGHAQIGVLSVDGKGNLAESIGTSFASPTVASLLAHVQHQPSEKLSNLMAKALVVHSAALSNGRGLTSDALRYRGYGIPEDVLHILGCDPWRSTLLFELDLRAGLDVQLTPFALPDCLMTDGSLRGEMTVTLVYEPPLNGTYGAEYCRTNVDVSLGTHLVDAEGERAHKRQVNPFPVQTEMSTFEKGLIEQGFKWSPIKLYRRAMPRGVSGDRWRLFVSATDRSGASNDRVRVAVAVTIAGTDEGAPVYNDVVKAMTRLGWSVVDVQLRQRARHRAA